MHMKHPGENRKNNNDALKQRGENGFVCIYCGRNVTHNAIGTEYRNHCPWCLRSVHLDNRTGDRASNCHGIMEPIAISVRRDNEWLIIHRCSNCGILRENRIAGDDNEMALLSLAVRPVALPAFPLDRLSDK